MPLTSNPAVHFLFYSLTGDIVFSGVCLALALVGMMLGESYQVRNDDEIILLRKPWPGMMAANVLGLYLLWLCTEMFICHFPLAVSLSVATFFSAIIVFLFLSLDHQRLFVSICRSASAFIRAGGLEEPGLSKLTVFCDLN